MYKITATRMSIICHFCTSLFVAKFESATLCCVAVLFLSCAVSHNLGVPFVSSFEQTAPYVCACTC